MMLEEHFYYRGHWPDLLLSEALGAPGSPQRTWDNNDWFPMLSQKGATALNSAKAKKWWCFLPCQTPIAA
jgi:hypothetical protein